LTTEPLLLSSSSASSSPQATPVSKSNSLVQTTLTISGQSVFPIINPNTLLPKDY
jgi:hypothetical protein